MGSGAGRGKKGGPTGRRTFSSIEDLSKGVARPSLIHWQWHAAFSAGNMVAIQLPSLVAPTHVSCSDSRYVHELTEPRPLTAFLIPRGIVLIVKAW